MKADNLYPFVAREAELAWLDGHLRHVLAGYGRVCFIDGEAGAGKTALIAEFARRAQLSDDKLIVGIGECNAQTGSGDAYLPFREMLRLLTGDTDADHTHPAASKENATRLQRFLRISGEALVESGPDLVGIFIPGGSLLARLGAKLAEQSPAVKRLHARLSVKTDPRVEVAGAESLRQDQVFEQYTNVVRGMAAACPLVLILDDLHWADEASLSLLFHLARRIEESRVLVIGSYRPNDVAIGRRGERHPMAPVLHELQRHYGDIRLELDAGDSAGQRRLVDALVDVQPNRIGEEFRTMLWRRTEGHPLFVVELLRHLQQTGGLARGSDGAWTVAREIPWDTLPARVEGVVAERINRLPNELHELLRVASVEGEQFSAEVLAQIRGEDPRGVVRRLSQELEKQHQLVCTDRILRIGGRRLSTYRFRHNLFHAYLYDELDEVERAYLHEDVGRALESFYGEQADEIAVQLARHFEQAGDLAYALAYRLTAGLKAQRQFANAEARLHFERTLELAGTLEGEPEHQERARRATLEAREALADVLALTGELDEARSSYEAVLAALPEKALLDHIRIHRKLGDSWVTQHRTEDALRAYDQAEALLGDASTFPDRAHALEWLHIQLQRMMGLYFSGSVDLAFADRVRPVVEQHATPVLRSRFFHYQVVARMRVGRYIISDEILQLAHACDEAARQSGSLAALSVGCLVLGVCHLDRGDPVTAEQHLLQSCRHARRAGSGTQLLPPLNWLAAAYRFQQRLEDARAAATEARALAESLANQTYLVISEMNLAWVALREQRLDEARTLASSALERAAPMLPFRWLGEWPLLGIALREGRTEDAVGHARHMLEPSQQQLPEAVWRPLGEAVQAWDAGDPDRAGAILADAASHALAAGYL